MTSARIKLVIFFIFFFLLFFTVFLYLHPTSVVYNGWDGQLTEMLTGISVLTTARSPVSSL